MTLAFISLGSNIAPESHLPAAVRELASLGALLAVSRAYETLPVGDSAQPRFVNAAALIETNLGGAELKAALKQIEQRLGRVRQPDKNASRTIDLDITLFGNAYLQRGQRELSDPELFTRAHIAIPLADLSPAHRHPLTGQTLSEIAAQTDCAGLVRRSDLALWPKPTHPRRRLCPRLW